MAIPRSMDNSELVHLKLNTTSNLSSNPSVHPKAQKPPILGVGDILGAGDSYLLVDFLLAELADDAFENLQREVRWQNMYHRGGDVPRLVAVEGEVAEDGSYPVYRHPADRSPPLVPFSATVARIRAYIEKAVGHPLNHVLVQLYRNGKDCISEHSDKTLDVVHGSNIVNVSFGAQRTMTLRKKRILVAASSASTASFSADETLTRADRELVKAQAPPRPSHLIPLPHNSVFVMGPSTNAQWLHGIHHDNRPTHTKSPAEQAYGGARISLTFRHIGTFLSHDEAYIWGQGAKGQTRADARRVVHDQREIERLTLAFGGENQQSDFVWDTLYGSGFDVLHFVEE